MDTTEKTNNKKGLLDFLEEEISDAKNGMGKSLLDVEGYANLYGYFLDILENGMGLKPSFKETAFVIPDIEIKQEYKKQFKDLIDDLYLKRILTYKNSFIEPTGKSQLIVSTWDIHEMWNGKNIVVKNKKGLREYRKRLKILADGIYKTESPDQQHEKDVPVVGEWWKAGEKPSFEENYEGGPIIMLGGQVCKIPDGTNQYILCKAIFSKLIGESTKEIDVIDKFFRGDESKQSFYDAIRGVNRKIKTKFGIAKLLKYEASKAWVDAELFK